MIFWIQLFVLGSLSHYLCYVFGSSGCYGFARAFQHLERKGKLRLARFSNTRDLVPLIPIHGMDGMGRSYRHVGMHIRLLGISKISQYWLRQALDVTYPKDDSWWPLLQRSFWANFLVNLNTFAGMKRTHHLSEHQKRIRFTLEFRSALAQTGWYKHIFSSCHYLAMLTLILTLF